MTSPPIVPIAVGLDLSLTAAGIATPRGIYTEGEKGRDGATLLDRRLRLGRQVDRVLDRIVGEAGDYDGPMVVAIESPTPSRIVGHQHDRSGLWWWVVRELSSWPLIDVVEIGNSSRAKYATGIGNSSKVAVASAATKRYGVAFADDNQADALVLRAMVLDHYGSPLAPVPARNRESLASVAWPTLDPEGVFA